MTEPSRTYRILVVVDDLLPRKLLIRQLSAGDAALHRAKREGRNRVGPGGTG